MENYIFIEFYQLFNFTAYALLSLHLNVDGSCID